MLTCEEWKENAAKGTKADIAQLARWIASKARHSDDLGALAYIQMRLLEHLASLCRVKPSTVQAWLDTKRDRQEALACIQEGA